MSVRELIEKLRAKFKKTKEAVEEAAAEFEGEYISVVPEEAVEEGKKFVVRVFKVEEYEDVRGILDSLREGCCVIIDIYELRKKDINEARRVVEKIKSVLSTMNGRIVALDERWIVAAPGNTVIERGK